MDASKEFLTQKKNEYLDKLEPLFEYINYFKTKEGARTSSLYDGGEGDNKLQSVPVPVYDSTVLKFVKAANASGLINRNYIYAYKKIGAQNAKDERLYISGATFKDIDTVIAIMAKYVIMGQTKGGVWAEAVEEGVWLHCLIKLKELLAVYDRPLA